jgi:Protein of unknown function (DUF3800)
MRFVFDKHGKIGRRAQRYWDQMKEIVDPSRAALLGSEPHFEDDFDFNPLQAADMYAWIIRDRLLPKDQLHWPAPYWQCSPTKCLFSNTSAASTWRG